MNSDRETKMEFASLIAALGETFGQVVTKATQLGYWMGLRDMELDAVRRGVTEAIRSCKFMPRPVEIRELSGDGSKESRAIEAWLVFKKAVKRVGCYRSVDFEDRSINAVVRSLGGWEYVCDLPADEFDKWLRMNFLKAHQAMEGRTVGEEHGAPLVGVFERTNGVGGHYHKSQEVLLIACNGHTRPAENIGERQVERIGVSVKKP